MSEFIYRAVNPRSDDDMHKYFKLAKTLSDYLKYNASFNEDSIRYAKIRMGVREDGQATKEKEFVFVCELDGEFVGYIDFCNYHMDCGEVIQDDIGAIHEIYVKEEFQKQNIAFSLLKMAVNKLLAEGKTKAVMEVQEDNKNRFLHFALAKGNVIKSSMCKRTDGTETVSYTLLADLQDIKNLTLTRLAIRTAHIKKKILEENLNIL